MAIASSQQSFLTNALTATQKPRNKRNINSITLISCRSFTDDHSHSSSKNEMKLAKLAIVTFAAGVLTLGPVHEASAAKTGGRVGGQAFRSSAPRSSPRINNSRVRNGFFFTFAFSFLFKLNG
uniref:Uncharacterized protein n=1 Tax=Nelumbo nucifera TaxID=4432 RepID=A0A822ZQR4_NELNU|nr:TPA_asm: hypothetical protein HUJ06_003995 [Nelumbo nucifera]